MLYCRDYAERLVASFYNQIQSEYYGVNIYVSIEGIALEHFSALPQKEINSSTEPCPRHAVFHSCLLDDSKKDSATTISHSNCLIELWKKQKLMSKLSTVWENTDGCAEQYRCATSL